VSGDFYYSYFLRTQIRLERKEGKGINKGSGEGMDRGEGKGIA
jgi:hypothetical protein